MALTYKSKRGSASFARKLNKLINNGHYAQARYLWRKREEDHGPSHWNPGYGLIADAGARCAFTNERIGI